ncbi:immunoglobulin lambda-1 light chain-like isoform X1 [Syngnathus scovelli]|uniref:immunoglobulin lambda-1 light chain-like isoform X1 n=1 Tax=Syngnathus scovelli TaxID=161590 RepID=UPI00211069F4|nr:immunoglobulin lambda-1 light chain-like isoform X1 [Syngnathus scovelli]
MLGTLCLLVSALTYGDAAEVVTQTPVVLTVTEGQQVLFDCNIQRDDGYFVSFYKQIPGDAPELILYHHHAYSSPSFGEQFQSSSGRFDVKTPSPVNYQFIIKQAKLGDSAEYYCSTWDSTAQGVVVFGGGTKVFVTSSDPPAPVVTVFPPASAELQSEKATLVCVATQSSPYPDVKWLANDLPVSGTVATDPAMRRADQTYTISSYLTVETSNWNADATYTCEVSLGSKSGKKTIRKSMCAT